MGGTSVGWGDLLPARPRQASSLPGVTVDPQAATRQFCCVRGGPQVPGAFSHARIVIGSRLKCPLVFSLSLTICCYIPSFFYLLLNNSLTPSKLRTTVEI